MNPVMLTRCNSCPAGLQIIPDGRGRPTVDKIKEKVARTPVRYAQSFVRDQRTAEAISHYTALKNEYKYHELSAVKVFIKNFLLADKLPLSETDQVALEQCLALEDPAPVFPKHTAQFIARLLHVKILDKDEESGKIKAGQKIIKHAAFIYDKLPINESLNPPVLHNSSSNER